MFESDSARSRAAEVAISRPRDGAARLTMITLLGLLIPLLMAGRSIADPAEEGAAVTVTGELEIFYVDDFEGRMAELQYFIKEKQSNKRFRLQFEGEPPRHLRAGSVVRVQGRAAGQEIYLHASTDGAEEPVTEMSYSTVVPAISGEQRTLVLTANFHDTPLSCSVEDVRDLMFTDPGDQSVDDYYQETSQGRAWLSGEVHGTYTIDNPNNCYADFTTYMDPMNAAAETDGVDLSQFDRKIYVMPYTGCGYAGVGSVGNTPSEALIFTCGIPDVYAHELGHNFGMYHASTPNSEYGDGTGIMGAGNVGLRHLNSAHQDEMGWRSPAMNVLVTESGTYDIAPQSLDEAQALAPQILRIAKPDTSEYYFVAYRRPLGFDHNLDWWYHDIVTVHRYQGIGGPPTNTYLVGELDVGEGFTDTSNGITVSHVSQTPDYATVQIAINGDTACSPGMPAVSVAPGSQSGGAGATLSYTVSVTNTDSLGCTVSNFALAEVVPAGWLGALSTAALALAPGDTGTATLSVTSAGAAAAGTYDVRVDVSEAGNSVHTTSGTASYVVTESCIVGGPSLSLTPASQSADAGTTLGYTVSLVNNDSAACDASSFDLAAALPAGWSGGVSPQTLALSPGATGAVSLSVASPPTATGGSYGLRIDTSDSQTSLHAGSAAAAYMVNEPATGPTEDTEAPTAPTGVVAGANHRKVNLSWSASSDNTAVAGYRVYRDGIKIATPPDASYADTTGIEGVVYAYSVDAYDPAGNASPTSESVLAVKAKAKAKGKGKGKGPNK
jgi:hypothetical protein